MNNSLHPSLLLLPSPPRPATRASLHVAYRVPLTAVLTRLSRERTPQVLIVAVAASVLVPSSVDSGEAASSSFSIRWRSAQALIGKLYDLIAHICANFGIPAAVDSDETGVVDARVVLIQHDSRAAPGEPPSSCQRFSFQEVSNSTVVLDLPTFAATVRPWNTIFHTSSESGYRLLNDYLAHAEGRQKILQHQLVTIDSGISFSSRAPSSRGQSSPAGDPITQEQASEQVDDIGDNAIGGYKTVCLGGTFDHLHAGHKLLLQAAVLLLNIPRRNEEPCTIIVGISNSELLSKKQYAEEMQSWDERARSVMAFLATQFNAPTTTSFVSGSADVDNGTATEIRARFCDGTALVRCVDIHDPFGPTITEEAIEAIVVSGETRGGGEAINSKRTARGWQPLDIYEIDVLDATLAEGDIDGGEDRPENGRSEAANLAAKISSTEIRRRKAEARKAPVPS
ncbi:hypothetical protein CP533_2610 [Ophiocordyceps camponoti-saundersi (nom. inval.)]|nr:hypothetical protein CP533_2610 [Ophiocordyceps camponoti-saundersi (nom. inval.)]